ncbi:C-type lectin domain family 4 member E-like isoform X3 [Gymnodraco acuticeps]|uniref:C-type lectin domain family 4 member E-like isoform X3 n=1 Tax=Gymnodraco acuticeps TaxID=8218 RepID=A0A6P8U7Z9_GYMAC|nr:C-type lectin domain family 4 member E-like isoform X3 [Gymnodraco acuticeps]
MELQEIPNEGETHEEGEPMLEVKTEEEAEPDHNSKLQSPSEDIYSEALVSGDPVKTRAETTRAGKPTEGNSRLYRAACLFLTIICLVLLLVVIILSLKHSSCRQCPGGWLRYGPSCFYLSTFRLSWEESRRNCSFSGGSLAVITNRGLQYYLTKVGKLSYWIGLRQIATTWTWEDKTELTESYWQDGGSTGGCGSLSSDKPAEKNWRKVPCGVSTYFICQL